MKRRILLVDDEVAVLLTMKAVLEISGFDVDTAASAREAKARLKRRVYDMVITDMRMESEEAGREVIVAARTAPYHPAVALLTAFPLDEADVVDMGADKMLVKATHTRVLLGQLDKLLESHAAKLKKLESAGPGAGLAAGFAAGLASAAASTAKAGAKVGKGGEVKVPEGGRMSGKPAGGAKAAAKKAGKKAGAKKAAAKK